MKKQRSCIWPVKESVERHAFKGDAVHNALLAMVVIDGVMPGGPVVPESDGAGLPVKAAGELLAGAVGIKKIQKRFGFFNRPPIKAHGEIRIDIKRLSASEGTVSYTHLTLPTIYSV